MPRIEMSKLVEKMDLKNLTPDVDLSGIYLEEPEVIKHEIIQEDLPDTDTAEEEENTVDTSENKTKKIVRTLFPKQWQNHFGDSSEDVVLLHRVKYCGNWDVLRPAKIVEGLEPISENLLDKLNEEAQNMIEKMRCAV